MKKQTTKQNKSKFLYTNSSLVVTSLKEAEQKAIEDSYDYIYEVIAKYELVTPCPKAEKVQL